MSEETDVECILHVLQISGVPDLPVSMFKWQLNIMCNIDLYGLSWVRLKLSQGINAPEHSNTETRTESYRPAARAVTAHFQNKRSLWETCSNYRNVFKNQKGGLHFW